MTGDAINLQTGIGAAGTGETLRCVLLGAVFTLGLFLGIAQVQNFAPPAPPPEFDDLRAVAIPLEPPPPPRVVPPDAGPPVTTVTGFSATATDSPVKITVTPPELADLLPPPPAAPAAVIQVGQLFTSFKPRMELAGDNQHIFQTSEVDQRPAVLYTVMPEVSRRMMKNEASAHVTVLLVIDGNGAVISAKLAQASGNPELDAVMLANIKEWIFSPATRKGVRVRCLIQQGYNIRLPAASRFNTES